MKEMNTDERLEESLWSSIECEVRALIMDSFRASLIEASRKVAERVADRIAERWSSIVARETLQGVYRGTFASNFAYNLARFLAERVASMARIEFVKDGGRKIVIEIGDERIEIDLQRLVEEVREVVVRRLERELREAIKSAVEDW